MFGGVFKVIEMDILGMAVSLFFMLDPIGNLPLIFGIIKDCTPKRQRMIILRESLFALVLMVAFLFFGKHILNALGIEQQAMSMTGGVILFLIGIKMSMSSPSKNDDTLEEKEPLVVPIAIPFIAGPGVLAMVMLMGNNVMTLSEAILALISAWTASTLLLLAGQFVIKLLGNRAMEAIQRLMGLALTAMAVQMFMTGLKMFLFEK